MKKELSNANIKTQLLVHLSRFFLLSFKFVENFILWLQLDHRLLFSLLETIAPFAHSCY